MWGDNGRCNPCFSSGDEAIYQDVVLRKCQKSITGKEADGVLRRCHQKIQGKKHINERSSRREI
jgi:hypothetical protein